MVSSGPASYIPLNWVTSLSLRHFTFYFLATLHGSRTHHDVFFYAKVSPDFSNEPIHSSHLWITYDFQKTPVNVIVERGSFPSADPPREGKRSVASLDRQATTYPLTQPLALISWVCGTSLDATGCVAWQCSRANGNVLTAAINKYN